MLDCRGYPLEVGNMVSVAWSKGHVIGRLIRDPDDVRYKTLRIRDEDGRVRFAQKRSSRVLNLTAFCKEQLDIPFRGMID